MDTYHCKSCLLLWIPLRRIFSNSRQEKGLQTIPMAHFPRLSFRTSFSFSPFGFSSVSYVTHYQPAAQSLFHTPSHHGRPDLRHFPLECGHATNSSFPLVNIQQPSRIDVCLFDAASSTQRANQP